MRPLMVVGLVLVQFAALSSSTHSAPRPESTVAAPIKDSNVKDFAGRFDRALSAVLDKLLPRLGRLRPQTGGREAVISLNLNAAGGSVQAGGLGLLLPKPSRYDLSLDLQGIREPKPKKGAALEVDGILQFDLITHGRNLADGLFRGVLSLGGKFRGTSEIYGEVRNGKIIGLVALSGSDSARSGKKPSPFVSYTGTLAGGSQGNGDGDGKQATFDGPRGVAVDNDDGSVYVADSGNGAIRKITPAGRVTTLDAELDEPVDVVVDDDDLIVGDNESSSAPLGRISLSTGALTPIVHNRTDDGEDLCGRILGSCEGRSPLGTMQSISGIDVQGGVIYAAQANYPPSLRMVLPDGSVTTVHEVDAGGREGGDCGDAGINGGTADVAKGNDGRLFYLINQTGCYGVLVLEPDGSVTTLAGKLDEYGDKDGTGAGARFFSPAGLTFDGNRYLYVSDTGNGMIRRVDVTTGEVLRVAGCPAQERDLVCQADLKDGNRGRAEFYSPSGLTLDEWGDLYVADRRNNAVRVVRMVHDPEREPAIFGFQPFIVARGQKTNVEVAGDDLGLAESASLGPDVAVSLQHAGSRKLLLDIEVSPTAEPGPRTLSITTAYGTVTGPPGLSFLIAEDETSGAQVETIAGTGSWLPGVTDGPGEVAQMGFPAGMVLVDDDRLLVADPLEQRIRLVATKTGVTQELFELALHASGGAGIVIGGVLAALGIAGEILDDLGLGAILGESKGNIVTLIGQGLDEMCARVSSSCRWLVFPWAGLPLAPGGKDGFRLGSTLFFPNDVAKGGDHKFFVSDPGNQRVRVVGIDPLGDQPKEAKYEVFSTVRTDERPLSVTDTVGDAALVGMPRRIVRVDMHHSGVFTDVVGVPGRIGCGPSPEGQLIGLPMGMDTVGGVTYVADPFCQTVWLIEDGQMTDIRGSAHIPGPNLGSCSDGPAAIARLGAPVDVAVAPNGDVWIVDALCNSVRVIRDLGADPDEVVDTFNSYVELFGGHLPEEEVAALQDRLNDIDERFLSSIRHWVVTVAGGLDAEPGYVDGPAERARFFVPVGIEVTVRNGKTAVFVADAGNHAIRLLTVP
ncbi:MAG: hypothetical protein ACRDLB_07350 [Actinomycetota bacterium]